MYVRRGQSLTVTNAALRIYVRKMVSEAGHVTGNTIKIVFVQYMVNC